MKKIIFAIALTCFAPCVASSAIPKCTSSSFQERECKKFYIYAEDITIIQDRIIVSYEESLYFSDSIHCDEDGLYVYQNEMQAILDGDRGATRHDYEYPDYADFYNR